MKNETILLVLLTAFSMFGAFCHDQPSSITSTIAPYDEIHDFRVYSSFVPQNDKDTIVIHEAWQFDVEKITMFANDTSYVFAGYWNENKFLVMEAPKIAEEFIEFDVQLGKMYIYYEDDNFRRQCMGHYIEFSRN